MDSFAGFWIINVTFLLENKSQSETALYLRGGGIILGRGFDVRVRLLHRVTL